MVHTRGLHQLSAFDYGTLPRISIKDIQVVAVFTAIILRTQNKSFRSIWRILMPWHKGEVNALDQERAFRVKAMLAALDTGHGLEYQFPIAHITRRAMARDMPESLLRLVHCCRKPSPTGQYCGKCVTCRELKQAGIWEIAGM